MYVTYSPADGDPQTWVFIPGRVRTSEQEIVERRAGLRWDEWVMECKLNRASARKVLLWHLLRRDHLALKLEDVDDFYADELLVELSASELEESREGLAKSGALDGDDGPAMIQVLEAQLAEVIAKHGDDRLGKVTSPTASTDTAG